MYEQMTIWDIKPSNRKSICLNCYYECKGRCVCWHSEFEDNLIPLQGCSYYDGCSGGIPSYEELRSKYV